MEIVQELKKIESQLKELKKSFNVQMNAIDGDTKEFHKQLTEVLVEHPELKSLVVFIVFTNDDLERMQKDMKSLFSETVNEIINIKKDIIRQNIRMRNENLKPKKSLNVFSKINEFKLLLMITLMILIILGFLVIPDNMIQLLSWMGKISLGDKDVHF